MDYKYKFYVTVIVEANSLEEIDGQICDGDYITQSITITKEAADADD